MYIYIYIGTVPDTPHTQLIDKCCQILDIGLVTSWYMRAQDEIHLPFLMSSRYAAVWSFHKWA